jgi:mannan endo-1,4-beta-mannosidase
LWADTHPEVHPAPVTPDELLERNVEYAAAIKEAWPEAEVAGFASWGWVGFTTLGNQYRESRWFLAEYLERMRQAEEQHGQRLIDYVDLHWYPDANAENDQGRSFRVTTRETFPDMVDLRTQIPRGLWDPSYVDPSWFSPGTLQLLVSLQSLVDEHYPGTKIAIGEWHYGAGHHISGGIAHAEVLGAFARERVGLATLWPHHQDEPYVRAAYRAYRNYDGAGASFGDQTVFAETNRPRTSSVFAGTHSDDPSNVVIIAINRIAEPDLVRIQITSDTVFTSARVFTLTAQSSALTQGADQSAVAANEFAHEMPGYSVSVLELNE